MGGEFCRDSCAHAVPAVAAANITYPIPVVEISFYPTGYNHTDFLPSNQTNGTSAGNIPVNVTTLGKPVPGTPGQLLTLPPPPRRDS